MLRCGDKTFDGKKTLVMGVLNVTPDSFSDGGDFFDLGRALEHAQKMLSEGADIIDIGGISTAPNIQPIDVHEELRRVIPVVIGLRKKGISCLCVDTMSATVARAALLEGASWINDQSAGQSDSGMAKIMAKADAAIIMHNGGGKTSGVHAGEYISYPSVMDSLVDFFRKRILKLEEDGVAEKNLIVDPGIGFGKGLKDSLIILKNMHRLNGLSAMSLVGVSRKSFIGKLTGIIDPKERDFASLGATAIAVQAGAGIVRTHNCKASVEMLSVLDACSQKNSLFLEG